MHFRLLMPLLGLIILLSGCKEDSSPGDRGSQAPAVRPATNVQVEGRVGLGFGAGAKVSIYPIVAGELVREVPAGEGLTNAEGGFQISVPRKYALEPALIEVRLLDGEFECYWLDTCTEEASSRDLTLTLAVPDLSSIKTYYVGLLSHLAASAAVDELEAASPAKVNGAENVAASYLVSRANTQVASRFGLIADLSTLPVLGSGSLEQLAEADTKELFNTSLEVSLLNECVERSQAGILRDALAFCVTQYTQNGVPGHTSDPNGSVVTLYQILSRMAGQFDRWEQNSDRDFVVERSEVLARRGIAANGATDEYSKGLASDNVTLPLIDRGKAFVENIRQIAASLNLANIVSLSDLSGFISGESAIALEDFGVVLEESELMTGDRYTRSLDAIALVQRALVEIIAEYYLDGEVTEKALAYTHSYSQGVHEIRFKDDVDTCSHDTAECLVYVDLAITVEIGSYLTTERVDFLDVNDLRISFEGNLSQSGYQVTFPGDSRVLSADAFHVRFDTIDQEELVYTEMRGLDGSIALEVAADTAQGTERFVGELELQMDDFAGLKRTVMQQLIEQGERAHERTTRYQLFELFGLQVDAAGRILMSTGNEFFAALNLTQSMHGYIEGLAELVLIEQLTCADETGCVVDAETSEFLGETEEAFIGVTASVAYKADLQGVAEPVLIQLSGSRKSPSETAINSLKVTYPGHALRLNGQFNNNGGITSMNATNLDGMEMFIETGEGGKRYGAVTGPGGEHVADVIDMGQWVKIPYPDGHFVSM